MDPQMTPGRSMPETRRFLGFARAVLRADLDARDRRRCWAIVARWPATHRHWRFMLWDVRVLVREVLDTRGRNLIGGRAPVSASLET